MYATGSTPSLYGVGTVVSGIHSSQCLQIGSTPIQVSLSGAATYFVGFYIKIEDIVPFKFLSFHYDDGIAVANNGYLQVNASGNVSAYLDPSTVLWIGDSSGEMVRLNQWQYIEVRWTVDDTAGTVQVKLNGRQILNLSSIDTQNLPSNNFPNLIKFYGPASIDDIYVISSTVTPTESFLGTSIVESSFPDNVGDESEWQSFPEGSLNFQTVNQTYPATSSYIYTNGTLPATDLYQMSDLVHVNNIIHAVNIVKVMTSIPTTTNQIVNMADTVLRNGELFTSSTYSVDLNEVPEFFKTIYRYDPVNTLSPTESWEVSTYSQTQIGPYFSS